MIQSLIQSELFSSWTEDTSEQATNIISESKFLLRIMLAITTNLVPIVDTENLPLGAETLYLFKENILFEEHPSPNWKITYISSICGRFQYLAWTKFHTVYTNNPTVDLVCVLKKCSHHIQLYDSAIRKSTLLLSSVLIDYLIIPFNVVLFPSLHWRPYLRTAVRI